MVKFVKNNFLLSCLSKLRGKKDTIRATRISLRWLFGLDVSIVLMRSDLEKIQEHETKIHEAQHHEDEKELGFFNYRKLYNSQIKEVGYWNNIFECRARTASRNKDFCRSVNDDPLVRKLIISHNIS